MSNSFRFDRYSASSARHEYNRYYNGRDFARLPRSEAYLVRTLVKSFGILPGSRVLDVGCGTGKYTGEFAYAGMAAVGVDLSEVGVNAARQRFPNARFEVADATELPFDRGEFDVVFVSGLSIFNDTNIEALRRLAEYLQGFVKPGGLFVFVKTSSLTDKPSRNNSRLDYSLATFLGIVEGSRATVIARAAVAPHAFVLPGLLPFSAPVRVLSALASRVLRRPLRVYIVARIANRAT